jgi:hypothetical protein
MTANDPNNKAPLKDTGFNESLSPNEPQSMNIDL